MCMYDCLVFNRFSSLLCIVAIYFYVKFVFIAMGSQPDDLKDVFLWAHLLGCKLSKL